MSSACTLPENPHGCCLPMAYGSTVRGPGDILRYLKWIVCPWQDAFFVLTLDAGQRIIQPHMVFFTDMGKTMNCVHEVYRPAMEDAAMFVVVVHTLSRDEDPRTLSEVDEELIHHIGDTGMVLEIPLLDYITTDGTNHFSCSDEGMR